MSWVEDLPKLAQKLASDGPHKYEKTPRRVRGLLNGKYVFDTTSAYHVWEHPYYPQFYIPVSSLTLDATLAISTDPIDGTHNTIHLGDLTAGSSSSSSVQVLVFNTPKLPSQLVKIPSKALDQWFEEDVPLYSSHPKDPYKRIEILPSSRAVKIALDGVVLAEAANPVFLFETLLRTRYYLPPTSVKWELLRKSKTTSYCPYKGMAEYYHAEVNGKLYEDVVWYYRYPTQESISIANLLCFYNEKVQVWVDGVEEK